MRTCPACNEAKSNADFSRSSRAKSGLQTYCKSCCVEMDYANPARQARYIRYRAKHPSHVTWSCIKKRAQKLGVAVIGMEQFVLWLERQDRHCEYCGMQEVEAKAKFGKNLHVDRKDGALGYVCGNLALACHRCNVVKNGYLTYAQMMQVAGMFFGGPVNNHEPLIEMVRDLLTILDEAESGFVPESRTDLAWQAGRDQRVSRANALLAALKEAP